MSATDFSQYIVTIASASNYNVCLSAAAYIEALITPINLELSKLSDISNINTFILEKFGNEIGPQIIDYAEVQQNDANYADNAVVYIIIMLAYYSASVAGIMGDTCIIPWDVQTAINSNDWLKVLSDNSDLLPVNVTVDDEIFTHNLSQDFVSGMMIFSIQGQLNFQLTSFGHLLPDFITARYKSSRSYTITFDDDESYGFDNYLVVLQGITTVALWSDKKPMEMVKSFVKTDSPQKELVFE